MNSAHKAAAGETRIRVLILDDNAPASEVMRHELLRSGLECDTHRVETETGFRQALEEFKPDVILADYSLPRFSGMQALRMVQKLRLDTPVILVSGTDTVDVFLKCLKAGVADFLLQDNFLRLGPAVEAALKSTRMRRAYKQAEDERATLAIRFSAFADSTNDAMIVSDGDGLIRYWNRAATSIFGFSADEMLGEPLLRIIPEHSQAQHVTAMKAAATSGSEARRSPQRATGLHKSGVEIPVEFTLGSWDEGDERFIMAVARDLTERAQAEQSLHDINDRLMLRDSALEAAANGIFIADPQGTILWANKAFARMTGYSIEEVVGKNPKLQKSGKQDEAFYREMWATIASGQVWRGEIVNRKKDGTHYIDDMTITPILDEHGEIGHYIAVKQDVTQRHQIEDEHQALEAQLAQAHKLESLGQLAAGIAHEINIPTQSVGDNTHFLEERFCELVTLLRKAEDLAQAVCRGEGSVELASELAAAFEAADVDYLEEEIPRAIEQSLDGVERIRKIVQSVKEISHPGAEEMIQLDLNSAIQSTIVVATNEWKYVARMETDLDPNLPPILCLPGQINQVLLDMIVNAAHAIADVMSGEAGEMGTITMSTRRAGDSVEIRIADTGIGIPEEARGKVFDRFYTTKEVGQGTRQGLSIAYAVVVKKHGGSIDFETEMGHGTTFVIRLPLQPTHSPREEVTA